MMAAATTVKVNDAADEPCSPGCGGSSTAAARRRCATGCSTRACSPFSQGAADVGLGLVLLVSAGAIAAGTFAVGTLALFAAYLGWLSFLPRMVGRMLARRKQAGVGVRPDAPARRRDATSTTRCGQRYLPIERWQHGVRPDAVRPPRVPLERLEVVGLAARYPDGAGVRDMSFTVERGSFMVLTGPVGSGKSTLLRAMLGLAWQAEVTGEVRWNGTPIDDRGAFLVPPNAAFLPQVPQLVSDSVGDNVALGPMDEAAIDRGAGAGGDLRRRGGDARRRPTR